MRMTLRLVERLGSSSSLKSSAYRPGLRSAHGGFLLLTCPLSSGTQVEPSLLSPVCVPVGSGCRFESSSVCSRVFG